MCFFYDSPIPPPVYPPGYPLSPSEVDQNERGLHHGSVPSVRIKRRPGDLPRRRAHPLLLVRRALAWVGWWLRVIAWVLLGERSSLSAYGWLWRHRRQILDRRRLILDRRLRPSRELRQWFFRRSLPL